MNTKNCIYTLSTGLVCALIILGLTTQPLYAENSTGVINEIEQAIPHEEPVREFVIPTPQENSASQDSTTPTTEADNETVTETEETTAEETTEEEKKETVSANTTPAEEYKSDEPDYLKKNLTERETKPHFGFISKVLNKFSHLVQRTSLSKNRLGQRILNKIKNFDKSIHHEQTITTLDFAPYYLLSPAVKDNYLEQLVFDNEVTNIMELTPFSLAIHENAIYKMDAPKNVVTPRGVTDTLVLMNAPSPKIKVLGKTLFAKLVIDVRNNTLYKYDKNGFPLKAYLVATGAYGMRTKTGLRIVTYKERFPYSGNPTSKRALDPYSYGPYIIFLNIVDPKTGRQSVVEQLLHGNGNEYSIGKKVSHGCIRTNNYVMKYELAREVKRGDYILITNPDID